MLEITWAKFRLCVCVCSRAWVVTAQGAFRRPMYVSVRLSVHPSVCPSMHMYICLCVAGFVSAAWAIEGYSLSMSVSLYPIYVSCLSACLYVVGWLV